VSKYITVLLNLFVESRQLAKVTEVLMKIPEVVDAYEVTGEYDVVATLHVETIRAFRELLKDKILKIDGVKSTVSSVVLHSYRLQTTEPFQEEESAYSPYSSIEKEDLNSKQAETGSFVKGLRQLGEVLPEQPEAA